MLPKRKRITPLCNVCGSFGILTCEDCIEESDCRIWLCLNDKCRNAHVVLFHQPLKLEQGTPIA